MQADKYLAFGLFTFLGLAVAAYSVRLALLGRARFVRLDKDGGSGFLAIQVMELAYWVLQPVVNVLHRLGATANGVTVFAILPGLGALFAAAHGWFGLTCLLGMTAAFCDALDGMLAKRSGGATSGGQALDSILDRVTESALFVGIALYFHASVSLLSLCLVGLIGAYMTSYVSAKADAMRVTLPRGVMRRPERAVYVLAGCAATPLWALWVPSDAPIAMRALPVLVVVGLVGVVANLSAMSRLRILLTSLANEEAIASGSVVQRPSHQQLPTLPAHANAVSTAGEPAHPYEKEGRYCIGTWVLRLATPWSRVVQPSHRMRPGPRPPCPRHH